MNYTFGDGTLIVGGRSFPVSGVRVTFDRLDSLPVFEHGESMFSVRDLDLAAFSSFSSMRDDLSKRVTDAIRAAIEDEVRHMLGQWVSEVEPCLIYGPNGSILGLGVAGAIWGDANRVIVRARPISCGMSACDRCASRHFVAGVNIHPVRCPRCSA